MIVGIEDNLPHEVSEVICLKCLRRWIAVYPQSTPFDNKHDEYMNYCPNCGAKMIEEQERSE